MLQVVFRTGTAGGVVSARPPMPTERDETLALVWPTGATLAEPGSAAGEVVFGAPLAAACGLARPGGWVELAWVAVVPAARGRGLGAAVCGALTRHEFGPRRCVRQP